MTCHHTQKTIIRISWNLRGKDGFYIVSALLHYRNFSVIAKDKNSLQLSETIELRHAYLYQYSITSEDRIIHGMYTLTCEMTDAPAVTFNTQLDAITNLHDKFGQLIDTITLKYPVPDPRVAPPAPPTSPPMMTCTITSVPRIPLSAPTPSVASTKTPYTQTVRVAHRAPRVVPNTAPTIQPTATPHYPTAQSTARSARVVMPPPPPPPPPPVNTTTHCTLSCAPIPTPENELTSR